MEYRAGTNPKDPASRFRPQASLSAGTGRVAIVWEGVPGRSYRVRCKNDLNEPNWNEVPGGVTVVGSRASYVDEIAGRSNQRFYQVMLVP